MIFLPSILWQMCNINSSERRVVLQQFCFLFDKRMFTNLNRIIELIVSNNTSHNVWVSEQYERAINQLFQQLSKMLQSPAKMAFAKGINNFQIFLQHSRTSTMLLFSTKTFTMVFERQLKFGNKFNASSSTPPGFYEFCLKTDFRKSRNLQR